MRSPTPEQTYEWGTIPLTSRFLDFSNTSDSEIIAIANTLAKNTMLKELYLGGNQIGDAGAVAIAESLAKNTVLEVLNLSNNQIGDTGAVAIAGALAKNIVLKTIHLGCNQIGNAGAVAIAKSLAKNTAPSVRIYLGGNQIDAKLLNRIDRTITMNRLSSKIRNNPMVQTIGVKEYLELGETDIITKQHLNLSPVDLGMVLKLYTIGVVNFVGEHLVRVCKAWRNLY